MKTHVTAYNKAYDVGFFVFKFRVNLAPFDTVSNAFTDLNT